MAEPKREFMEITPEKAREFLDHNIPNNRNIKPVVVTRYAAQMSRGKWNEDVSKIQDPIIISDDGFMLNGQHRCQAIIKSGKTIRQMVTFGVDKSIYKHLDNGSVRGARDYINAKNANAVAALAKVLYALENGKAPLISTLDGHIETGKPPVLVSREDVINTAAEEGIYLDGMIRLGWKLGSPFHSKNVAFQAALITIDFVGRGDALEQFVDDFSALISESRSNTACKNYMSKCFLDKRFKSDKKWILGCILAAYEAYQGGTDVRMFNKSSVYLSKYDNLVKETRRTNK